MAKLIAEFLSKLADDSFTFGAYVENPENVMKDFGLSEEQQETLLSNDLGRIREAIRRENAEAQYLFLVYVPQQHITASRPEDEG
jgi:hypothetical protein